MMLPSATCGLEMNNMLGAFKQSCAEEVYKYASRIETCIPESGDSVSPALNSEDKETEEDMIQEQRGLEWNIILIDS